jgi:hypothetical protein
VQNPHHGEASAQRRHGRDPKGSGAEALRSGTHDVSLILSFQALTNTVRDTTKELRNATAQYVTSSEAAQLHLAPSNGREASSNVTFHDANEVAKGGRNRHKQCL